MCDGRADSLPSVPPGRSVGASRLLRSAQAIWRDEVHWWGSPCTFSIAHQTDAETKRTRQRLVSFRPRYLWICT